MKVLKIVFCSFVIGSVFFASSQLFANKGEDKPIYYGCDDPLLLEQYCNYENPNHQRARTYVLLNCGEFQCPGDIND